VLEEIFSTRVVGVKEGIWLVVSQDVGRLLWHSHSLVWIYGKRVSFLGSIKQVSVFLREGEETTPTGVDVMPHIVLLADSVDGMMVIEGSHDGSTGH